MNKDWYHPNGLAEPRDWDDVSGELLGAYRETADSFHIGQTYEKEPAKVIECRTCGGRNFQVARGSFFTGISCVTCQWECCIHSG